MSTDQIKTELQNMLGQSEKQGQADTSISDNNLSADSEFQNTIKQLGMIKYFRTSIEGLIKEI